MKLSSCNYRINNEDKEIYFRPTPSSDYPVIHQIFEQKVYSLEGWAHEKIIQKYFESSFQEKHPLIIDAGANIGASSLYFSNRWLNSLVISVEPEKTNYTLLRLNTLGNNIISLEGGIGKENGEMFLNDPGHGDVGFRVSETGEYRVDVFSAEHLIEIGKNRGFSPFICKIDIEGGEADLFSKNIEWIDLFPLIIIELHDWMLPLQGSSRNFMNAINRYDFEILQKGENLFFFNRKLLTI